ncbi:hypothetical protein RB594_005751 [Gaeumannomyces avenae]
MPISSPYSPLDVPDVDLWTLLFERESKPFLDSKALFTDGRTGHTLDYGRLRSAALDFGHGLKALWGWRRGDVLAFYTPNSVDTPILTAGLLWAGGVASPANPLYTADELAFQLRDSGAKALVTQRPFLDVAARAAAAAGIPHDRIILIGEQQQAESESESDSSSPRQQQQQQQHRYKHFSSIRATFYCSRYAQTLVEPAKDLAFLVYSSGTTGLPKGVCLTHRNIVANILQGARTDGQHLLPHGGFDGKGDRLLGLIPFFHVYGLTSCILMTMYAGWEVILMERFDMERACQLIEKHRVTYIYVPPPVVLAFAKSPIVDNCPSSKGTACPRRRPSCPYRCPRTGPASWAPSASWYPAWRRALSRPTTGPRSCPGRRRAARTSPASSGFGAPTCSPATSTGPS